MPYRDSKLTRLLQDSLGGNAKTVMIANVGPGDYSADETISTLRYAARAKSVRNKPRINEDPKDAMLREFQQEIERLKAQLAERQQRSARPPSAAPPGAAGGDGQPVAASQAALRSAVRRDLQAQLRQAASVEGLAKAREAAEQSARARFAAQLRAADDSQAERARLEAALAAQQAELEAYAAEVEAEQRERLELEQRLQAMEGKARTWGGGAPLHRGWWRRTVADRYALHVSPPTHTSTHPTQVLRGGENLLERVDQLEAAAAEQRDALVRQRAACAERERRIMELQAAAGSLEGQYNSAQVTTSSGVPLCPASGCCRLPIALRARRRRWQQGPSSCDELRRLSRRCARSWLTPPQSTRPLVSACLQTSGR